MVKTKISEFLGNGSFLNDIGELTLDQKKKVLIELDKNLKELVKKCLDYIKKQEYSTAGFLLKEDVDCVANAIKYINKNKSITPDSILDAVDKFETAAKDIVSDSLISALNNK